MPKHVRWLLLAALTVGCDERERLTFEPDSPPTDTRGPLTVIDIPGQDTVITASEEDFILGGRVIDAGGVDVVHVEITGAGFGFQPIEGNGVDTLRFGLRIPTAGENGRRISVRIFGLDVVGNPGPAAIRNLTIE